jgi:hypothetical protein
VSKRRQPAEVVVVGDEGAGVVHRGGHLRRLASGGRTGVEDAVTGLCVECDAGERRHLLLSVCPAVDVRPGAAGVSLGKPEQPLVPVDGLVRNAALVERLTNPVRRDEEGVRANDRGERLLTGGPERPRVVDERFVPLEWIHSRRTLPPG